MNPVEFDEINIPNVRSILLFSTIHGTRPRFQAVWGHTVCLWHHFRCQSARLKIPATGVGVKVVVILIVILILKKT